MNFIGKIKCFIRGRHEYKDGFGFRPIGYTKASDHYNRNITVCGIQKCACCGKIVEL